MARNKLSDLQDHLFEMIERVKDKDVKEEDLTAATRVNELARTILEGAKVELKAMEMLGMSKGFTSVIQSEPKKLSEG